eukprot:1139345-Pelagomonas_calceolata.AAC.7
MQTLSALRGNWPALHMSPNAVPATRGSFYLESQGSLQFPWVSTTLKGHNTNRQSPPQHWQCSKHVLLHLPPVRGCFRRTFLVWA